MTATERVCELLDERGVEYRTYGTTDRTWFEVGNISWFVIERENGNLTADAVFLTPEQVISVTLGDVPRLPHFWTHDGTLHVELPKLPESISVRLPDQRDREVGSARVWQYTRDSGTCQKVYLVETSDDLIESWHPIGVYLSSKAAGDCAEALRGEVDGIRQFARVVELKVVDE